MRFYGLTDEQVLDMPGSRFWYMNNQVERIQASESASLIPIAQMVQADEKGVKQILQLLKNQIGEVAAIRPVNHKTSDLEKARLRALNQKAK